MNFSLIDAGRLLPACAAGVPLLLMPGLALAALVRRALGTVPPSAAIQPGLTTGLVFGLSLLPLIASLGIRALGIEGTLALVLALALAGLFGRPRPSLRIGPIPAVLLVLWFALVLFEWIDFDTGTALYQPVTVIDAVKHAATSQAILDTGAPPRDPFFLRPERVGYYYYFYSLPALVQRLCGDAVDAKAAVGGVLFWVGIALFGLIRMVLRAAGCETAARRPLLVAGLMLAGGLDIIPVVRMGLLQGGWLPDPIAWNEQVTGWIESLLWVPHHVTALIAVTLGLLVLASATATAETDAPSLRHRVAAAALAGLCFASAFGTSIWVTFGFAGLAGLWVGLLGFERRWGAVALVVTAGVVALIVSIPQLHDVLAHRDSGGVAVPIVPSIRPFSPVESLGLSPLWLTMARLAALPFNYFAGFGVLVSGSILYWRDRQPLPAEGGEVRRILLLAAVAGLLLGSLLRSTLFNNDLGWRVMLFPLLAGTVWTLVVLDRLPTTQPVWRRVPGFLLGLMILGWATTLYAVLGLRLYPFIPIDKDYRFMAAHPVAERALRVAYDWANRSLPPEAVLQHDPTRARAFAFGLYGVHPTAVADLYGSLYGADPRAVEARIAALSPVFRRNLPDDTVRGIATSLGIDDVVVTDADPVWSVPGSFVWRWTPAYASDHVRIMPVAEPAAEHGAADR